MRFLIPFALFIIVDFYLYQAVLKSTQNLSKKKQNWIKWIYWSIPVIFSVLIGIAFVSESRSLFYPILPFILLYLSKLLGVVILSIEDLSRGLRWIVLKIKTLFSPPKKELPGTKISRSTFISQTALAATAVHTGAFGWGILSGAHDYTVHRVSLALKNLPAAFDGMVIGQLSDIHSGSFYKKTAVQGGVDMLLEQKPDLVFFTGDLVNNEAKELNEYFDIFKQVKAPLGVYSIMGNHDYGDYHRWENDAAKQKNLEMLKKGHQTLGWDLLLDEHRRIKIGNESIGILGIQNWGEGGFAKYGDLDKALQQTDDFPVKLLLSHDPSHWRAQVLGNTNIDAVFAGHTHGMQYGVELGGFKFSPAQLRYKEWAGLYTENDQHLYVNRGFGYLGYPGRIGILPEITLIELKKA
ncbi:MAG: metallophosphoesterase [Lutimonas sp.]